MYAPLVQAWSLYTSPARDTYAGHEGYDDKLRSHYGYDSGVPNHSGPGCGDPSCFAASQVRSGLGSSNKSMKP